jgi:hypothetical protein
LVADLIGARPSRQSIFREESRVTVTGPDRHYLYQLAKDRFDEQAAEGLMNLLPTVGWTDVAIKQDIALMRQDVGRLEGRMDHLHARVDGLFHRMLAVLTATIAALGVCTAVIIAVLG